MHVTTTTTQARLTSVACALPHTPVPATYWDEQFGWPSGTTAQRTGIERRFRCAPDENAHTLAATAIRRALGTAQLTPRDVGLVIDSSACIQQPLPSNAACLLETLGVEWSGVPGIDVRNTCLGFLAGLHVAQALVAAHHHILVVSSETPWAGLRHDDPDSAPLFGEGAAAAIVSWSPHPRRYLYSMQTYGEHRPACQVLGGGHRLPPFAYHTSNDSAFRFAMDGARLHKIASTLLPPLVRQFRSAWPDHDRLDWVPHPASGPAVELMRRRLQLPADRFICTIREHGNLISAGIPCQLAQARARGGARSFVSDGTAAGYSQAILAWEDSDAP